MSRFVDDDVEASAIARKLRGFSDHDLAWLEFISPPNVALICGRLKTTPHILMLAQQYETARRKAYSEIGGNDVADGRDLVLGNRPVAPFHSEIGAPIPRSEAAGTGCGAPPVSQRPAAVPLRACRQ